MDTLPQGRYAGTWISGAWKYYTVLDCAKLRVDGGILKGEVEYTLLKAKQSFADKVGRTETEFFEGSWDPTTRIVEGRGTGVTDETVIGISDRYHFRFEDNKCIGRFGSDEACLELCENNAAVPTSTLPRGRYTGKWVSGDWEYFTVLDGAKLKLHDGILTGEVEYTLRKAPEDYADKVGRTETEFFRGTWDLSSGSIEGRGTEVTDETVIGVTDRYHFRFRGNKCIGRFGSEEVCLELCENNAAGAY